MSRRPILESNNGSVGGALNRVVSLHAVQSEFNRVNNEFTCCHGARLSSGESRRANGVAQILLGAAADGRYAP